MNRVIFSMLVVALLASPATNAAVSDAEFEQLREQLATISQRLEELAAENAELRRAQAKAQTEGDRQQGGSLHESRILRLVEMGAERCSGTRQGFAILA